MIIISDLNWALKFLDSNIVEKQIKIRFLSTKLRPATSTIKFFRLNFIDLTILWAWIMHLKRILNPKEQPSSYIF